MHMCVLRHIKEGLVWAIDKWLWVISNIMLKTSMVITKELKENAISVQINVVCGAGWSLVIEYICAWIWKNLLVTHKDKYFEFNYSKCIMYLENA